MARLTGRVALVTDSGHGLGAEICTALAACGARVVVNDGGSTSAGRASQVAAGIRNNGGEALSVEADTATWDGGIELVNAAVAAFGSIDILVSCPGIATQDPLAALTQETWQSSLAVSMKATVACASQAARAMVRQGNGGAIITLAWPGAFSAAGPAHSAAQAGVMGIASAMSMALVTHKVTVNCVMAGSGLQNHEPTEPLAAIGLPPLVVYLASPAAADITGRYFSVSEGQIAIHNKPLGMEGSNVLLRKPGGWLADELDGAIRPVLMIGQG